MAKTVIIDSLTGSRTPFLRGILTRSLQNSGVSFEKAYAIASAARDEIVGMDEVQSVALRELVVDIMARDGLFDSITRYSDKSLPAGQITVLDLDGTSTAFSTTENRKFLESCGLTADEALMVMGRLLDSLQKENELTLPLNQVEYRIYKIIKNEFGPPYDLNYLVWKNFNRSDKPLLLLVGGATGSGKSTISTEIAHNLNIVRTQSSDMLREVMRIMTPPKLLPTLHTSSFMAWSTMPNVEEGESTPSEKALLDGFSMQSGLLSVGAEAVLNRALKERVSLILEGIHIMPTLLGKIPQSSDATVVMIMLAVLKQGQLKKQIRGRGDKVPGRRAKRYLQNFDQIWSIQSHLLSEADRCEVPIVVNDNKDRALREIMNIIVSQLAKQHTSTPKELFGL